MARRDKDMDEHREGDPHSCIASPITTGFSPAQGGTLDKIKNLGEPDDTLERLPIGHKGRREK